MYYVYILKSLKDQSYYVGYSGDPEARLEKHNKSRKGYTARKKPWELVYMEGFESKTEAIKREKYIKAQKSLAYIESLINNVDKKCLSR